MKRLFWHAAVLLAMTGVFSILAGAQRAQPSPEELGKRYKKKLEKPFVKKIAWKMALDEAMTGARARDRFIMGFFTRSYQR